jgi:hypothetical protein
MRTHELGSKDTSLRSHIRSNLGAIDFVGDPNILPPDLKAELAGTSLIGDPNLARRFDLAGGSGLQQAGFCDARECERVSHHPLYQRASRRRDRRCL